MDTTSLLTSYIVWGDDGADGKLLVIDAPDKNSIVLIFPLFVVFSRTPPWISASIYADLVENKITSENIKNQSFFQDLSDYLMLINSGGRRTYIVINDYGQGGIWLKVRAQNPQQIIEKFPYLNVLTRCPPWLSNTVYEEILYSVATVDIEILTEKELGL